MTALNIAQLPPIGVSNRFSATAEDQIPIREPTLILDSDTGLLSLGNSFTVNELRHSYDWLKYNEPESHCGSLAEEVWKLANIPSGAGVTGLSWKDAGLMEYFALLGHDTAILFPRGRQKGNFSELGTWERDSIDVQELISEDNHDLIGSQSSFISARHILEHATSIENFMTGLAANVSPDGYVLLEVPDCEGAIASGDYSIIWEEHVHYFTVNSLQRTLQRLGWRVVKIYHEIVDEEAILIAIVQPPRETVRRTYTTESQHSNIQAVRFGGNFKECRSHVMSFLTKKQQSGRHLYLLEANHTASNFIDLFGEVGLFEGCLDDSSEKQGRYISAKSVPVLPIEELSLGKDAFVFSAIHHGRAEVVERKLDSYLESRSSIQ